ncbi:MAG: CBS domain-containing protein [Bacteroidales bacterium]|nr:CBS domain-containing protein [Bacteroidales bacterium]
MFDNSYYDNTFAHDLMRIPPAIIEKSEKMKSVINKFNKTDSWNLPVTENNRYIGFVSKSRMFNEYRKLLVTISHE